jgi:hypothetical protein
VKDSLAILLLMKGQADQQQGVVAFVLDRTKPMRLRELAARALGDRAAAQQDASLGPVLARVIREDAQGVYRQVKDPKTKEERTVVLFPVRRAAAEGISKMQKQGMLLESYVTAAADRAQIEVKLPRPPPLVIVILDGNRNRC